MMPDFDDRIGLKPTAHDDVVSFPEELLVLECRLWNSFGILPICPICPVLSKVEGEISRRGQEPPATVSCMGGLRVGCVLCQALMPLSTEFPFSQGGCRRIYLGTCTEIPASETSS